MKKNRRPRQSVAQIKEKREEAEAKRFNKNALEGRRFARNIDRNTKILAFDPVGPVSVDVVPSGSMWRMSRSQKIKEADSFYVFLKFRKAIPAIMVKDILDKAFGGMLEK